MYNLCNQPLLPICCAGYSSSSVACMIYIDSRRSLKEVKGLDKKILMLMSNFFSQGWVFFSSHKKSRGLTKKMLMLMSYYTSFLQGEFFSSQKKSRVWTKKMLMLAIGQLLSNCARKRASGAADTGANVSKPQIIVSKYAKSQKGK